MSLTWTGAEPPEIPSASVLARLWAVARLLVLVVITLTGMVLVVALRLIERLIPWRLSTRVVQIWGRAALMLVGLRLVRRGRPMAQGGVVVANHSSWLDIVTLFAADGVTFVSKAEVAGWPVIGQIARLLGTVFIDRKPASSARQAAMVADRLARGERLCIFPEGTSTDGLQVLRFRSPLFAALGTPSAGGEGASPQLWVQPVSVIYHAPSGLPEAFYGWWGEMALAPHLLAAFSWSKGRAGTPGPRARGVVEVIHHDPIPATTYANRKLLAAAAEEAVRGGLDAARERGRPD